VITIAIGLFVALFFYIASKEHHDDKVKEAVQEWERQNSKYHQSSSISYTAEHERSESSPLLPNNPSTSSPRRKRRRGLSTKYLNPGKERMTAGDWIKMPQFYMVRKQNGK
jgi:hypothetical protein